MCKDKILIILTFYYEIIFLAVASCAKKCIQEFYLMKLFNPFNHLSFKPCVQIVTLVLAKDVATEVGPLSKAEWKPDSSLLAVMVSTCLSILLL